jgi:hypothetical protein
MTISVSHFLDAIGVKALKLARTNLSRRRKQCHLANRCSDPVASALGNTIRAAFHPG